MLIELYIVIVNVLFLCSLSESCDSTNKQQTKNQILNIHMFVPFVYPQDGKAAKAPAFERLTYADAGVYVCEVATGTLKRSLNFQLVVEGEHCPPSSTPPTV
jgi:hypothetical protein